MHEHDGQRLGVGPAPASALGRRQLVHLDMEGYAVLRDDRDRRRAQRPELGGVAHPAVGDDPAAVRDPGGGTGDGQPGCPGGVREGAATQAHAGASSESTIRRVNRPPIRVTIS